jgi:MFS family permease
MQVVRLVTVKSHLLSAGFGRLRAVCGLFGVILCACACLIFIASPVLSIVMIAVIGGGMALAEPMIIDEQNRSVKTGDRATVLSVYSMCGSVAAAAINPFIGLSADSSVRTGFAACTALIAAAVVLLGVYMRAAKKA